MNKASKIKIIDFLITFNRKHLRNKEEEINKILIKEGLRTVKIVGPEKI